MLKDLSECGVILKAVLFQYKASDNLPSGRIDPRVTDDEIRLILSGALDYRFRHENS